MSMSREQLIECLRRTVPDGWDWTSAPWAPNVDFYLLDRERALTIGWLQVSGSDEGVSFGSFAIGNMVMKSRGPYDQEELAVTNAARELYAMLQSRPSPAVA